MQMITVQCMHDVRGKRISIAVTNRFVILQLYVQHCSRVEWKDLSTCMFWISYVKSSQRNEIKISQFYAGVDSPKPFVLYKYMLMWLHIICLYFISRCLLLPCLHITLTDFRLFFSLRWLKSEWCTLFSTLFFRIHQKRLEVHTHHFLFMLFINNFSCMLVWLTLRLN